MSVHWNVKSKRDDDKNMTQMQLAGRDRERREQYEQTKQTAREYIREANRVGSMTLSRKMLGRDYYHVARAVERMIGSKLAINPDWESRGVLMLARVDMAVQA